MRHPTKAAPGQPPGATAQSLRPLAQITNQNPYHLVPEVARYRVTSGPRWTNGAHTSNTKVYAATLWELGSNFWRGRQLRKSRRKGVFLDGITKKRCCQPRFRTVDRERPNLSTLTCHPCMSKRTPDLRVRIGQPAFGHSAEEALGRQEVRPAGRSSGRSVFSLTFLSFC